MAEEFRQIGGKGGIISNKQIYPLLLAIEITQHKRLVLSVSRNEQLRLLLIQTHFVAFLLWLVMLEKVRVCLLNLRPERMCSPLFALPASICSLRELKNGGMSLIFEHDRFVPLAWDGKRLRHRERGREPLEKPAKGGFTKDRRERTLWSQGNIL